MEQKPCIYRDQKPEAPWLPWDLFMHVPNPDLSLNPYVYKLVEIKLGQKDSRTSIIDPASLPPAFNVYGLLWRPVSW